LTQTPPETPTTKPVTAAQGKRQRDELMATTELQPHDKMAAAGREVNSMSKNGAT